MRRPYSVLLPVGFALPPLLPKARCALTAPFRPGRHECTVVYFPCQLFAIPMSMHHLSSGSFTFSLSIGNSRQPFGYLPYQYQAALFALISQAAVIAPPSALPSLP